MSKCQCGMELSLEELGAGFCLHIGHKDAASVWWVVFTRDSFQGNFKQNASWFWPLLSLAAEKRVKQHRQMN